jgi:hypothetical protein
MEDNQSLTPSQETPPVALENPPAEEDNPPAPGRSIKWFIIGGVLVIFLAAAAFLGARLLKPAALDKGGGSGPMLVMKGGPGGGASQKSLRLDIDPAPELPKENPTTNGIFVRREDQSIFIGTGNLRMMFKKSANNSGGEGETSSSYDGPVVEVVSNHETKVYQDITDMTPPDPSTTSGGTFKVKQVLKPGSLDDLGKNSMVTMWGDKQGDRFIARVIVFR